ncbi:MAG: XRE family transcriptional regulator [Crocinitomicaceae bacterium TMED209]|nr:MAG: XRE family transcriptional regulator [Crocinitomicaceae bacterium TMED209]|tara:strand:+ start:21 stop:500 length:480 start_codon:yes stop_codon:yes gene_type:complete
MVHPAQRLKQLIDALGMNINSFSKECGYPSSATIWRIVDDNKKPSTPTLNKICNRFPQVNREWLLTGLGNMFTTTTSASDDLTVTSKQIFDKFLPLTPDPKTIINLEKTMIKVESFLSQFEQTQKEIEAIHDKITSIEFLEALKLIKARKKEKNGNGLN